MFGYKLDDASVVAFLGGPCGTALVKVSGDLVVLDGTDGTAENAIAAASGPVRLAVDAGEGHGWGVPDDLWEAQLRFAIEDDLDAGYVGYTDCTT